MTGLKVYQIGVGNFGKYGFEKLVELHNEFQPVDVELKGVCDSNPDRLEKAEKFAEANGIELETFSSAEKMYDTATREEDQVMVYDAGSAETHADHVYKSMQHGFFHLAEKPPSMTREQHIREKELAEKNQAMWKCDFIERENPVVKKSLELLDEETEIESVKVFRESSMGVQKLLDPVHRIGVKGGDILDKMVHDVYILDFLEESGNKIELDLERTETEFFLPKARGSEKLMSIDGNYTESIEYETATAQTSALFDAGGVEVEFHSSWLGLSDEAMIEGKRIRGEVDHVVFDREYSEINGKAFVDEECRFFVIDGDVNLMGDLLHQKLYDLEAEEQIPLDYYLHDQLYRVIEKAVLQAAGKEAEVISGKETDVFMNAIFNVKEGVTEEGDFLEERKKVLEKVETMIVEDGKILEDNRAETLAG